MITLAKFSIAEVLPFTGKRAPNKIYYVNGIPYVIKMTSLRYQTFQKSLNCVECGLTGDIFLLQYSPFKEKKSTEVICHIENCTMCAMNLNGLIHRQPEGWEKPHFNLYHVGKRGGLILMTRDHIIPRSKGGADRIENLQTMCTVCNGRKGNTMPGVSEPSPKVGD